MPRPGRELEAATRSHERVGNIIEDSATPAGYGRDPVLLDYPRFDHIQAAVSSTGSTTTFRAGAARSVVTIVNPLWSTVAVRQE
jgi:hypothetical protein